MEAIIQFLQQAPLGVVILAMLAENLVIFGFALGLGHWLLRCYAHRPVSLPAPPVQGVEVAIALNTVLLNTAVTLVGLVLWRQGIIHFRTDVGLWAWLDVLALLLIMDLAMYALHRAGHIRWVFPLLHRMHHSYDRPRPLTLFVLNPVENLSFGILWLLVISIYPASWLGMSIYLFLNVVFGTIGHIGVEPFPSSWPRLPVLKYIAGSSFHAQHHQDLGHNFGFYFVIWDRVFGTLRPDYEQVFGRIPELVPASR